MTCRVLIGLDNNDTNRVLALSFDKEIIQFHDTALKEAVEEGASNRRAHIVSEECAGIALPKEVEILSMKEKLLDDCFEFHNKRK